jgi:hypothetical protein
VFFVWFIFVVSFPHVASSAGVQSSRHVVPIPRITLPAPIQSPPVVVSFPHVPSSAGVQSSQHVVPFPYVASSAPVQSPPPVVSPQRFVLQQIDGDHLSNSMKTKYDGPYLNEELSCAYSTYATTESVNVEVEIFSIVHSYTLNVGHKRVH